jgi:hypothetical protein
MRRKGGDVRDVEIVLDKPRNLRFTTQALLDLQRMAGGEPLGSFIKDLGNISIQHLLWLLRAGLKHEQPKLTESQVATLVDRAIHRGATLATIMETVNKALIESGLFTEPGEGDALDPQTPTAEEE